ncbi:MAG TPA: sulfite oxidase [Gemmataceae bacterium]|jgi:DMSO/TMAO reductase YedYZ molybdopterin-dependent catalytic subunit|nr:sulfite oxidase [Gemmataceae bacterium]
MPDRREFLYTAAALPFLARGLGAAPRVGQPPADVVSFSGLILRQQEPHNFEFPFTTLDRFILPTERFYVRNHFAVPKIDMSTWRLKVEGAVENKLELTLDDIKKLGSQTRPVTLECAGNGRVYLVPPARGVAWQLGAVGNAEWTGAPLAALLEKAGARMDAAEVAFVGADSGTINDEPKSPGPIHFARSIPMAKAHSSEVILAWAMNGADLTADHGAPVRVIVPGWYGMASVKWLTNVIVSPRGFRGWFQTYDYSYHIREDGQPVTRALSEIQVKSSIARPALGEIVPAKNQHRVFGAAWMGEGEITKVDVSTDGGKTWAAATLLDKPVKYAWRLWEYIWKTPDRPGKYTLMCRATAKTDNGREIVQPMSRNTDFRNYAIHHVVPVEVEVK